MLQRDERLVVDETRGPRDGLEKVNEQATQVSERLAALGVDRHLVELCRPRDVDEGMFEKLHVISHNDAVKSLAEHRYHGFERRWRIVPGVVGDAIRVCRRRRQEDSTDQDAEVTDETLDAAAHGARKQVLPLCTFEREHRERRSRREQVLQHVRTPQVRWHVVLCASGQCIGTIGISAARFRILFFALLVSTLLVFALLVFALGDAWRWIASAGRGSTLAKGVGGGCVEGDFLFLQGRLQDRRAEARLERSE